MKDCAGGHIMAAKDSSPSKTLYPEWQNEYQAALLELDRRNLAQRVAAAEAAIYKRLQMIAESSDAVCAVHYQSHVRH